MVTIKFSGTRPSLLPWLLLSLLALGVCAALLLPLLALPARARSAPGASEARGDSGMDLLAFASPATLVVVTNTNDSGSRSLRDVINAASPGETVVFSLTLPATIVLTSGNIGISTDLTVSGPGSDKLTISANNAGDIFVLNNSQVNIISVTLRNANSAGYGGAIVVNSGALTLTNSSVLSNTASAGGGGIAMFGASLSISNSIFMSNTAPTGAAIDILTGTVQIVNSMLSGNSSLQGGAIYNNTTSSLRITHSTLSNNQALDGGNPGRGGAVESFGTLRITGSTILGNHADTAAGAIDISGGTAAIADTTISGNSGGNGAGGIDDYGVLTITNSTLNGNRTTRMASSRGGALTIETSVTATLVNSTVSGNVANDDAGGIYVDDGAVNLIGVTIANNTADNDNNGSGRGGGLSNPFGGGIVNLQNTIIAGNTAKGGAGGPDCFGTVDSQDYNLVQNIANCSLGGVTSHNITGQDPMLAPLANYGGPTQTQGLATASPALDKIPAGMNGCGTTLATDQRGAPRPQNGACDIGAFEGKLYLLDLPLIVR